MLPFLILKCVLAIILPSVAASIQTTDIQSSRSLQLREPVGTLQYFTGTVLEGLVVTRRLNCRNRYNALCNSPTDLRHDKARGEESKMVSLS